MSSQDHAWAPVAHHPLRIGQQAEKRQNEGQRKKQNEKEI
jgi:hypothetical protein